MPAPPTNWNRINLIATSIAVLLAGYWSLRVALFENHLEDLWIYSSGSVLGFQGVSPYEVERIHDRVSQRWPNDENLDGNSGFFLTPQAMLTFAPFAVLPWEWAKPIWCLATIGLGVAVAWGLAKLADKPLPGWFPAVAVVAVLLNPLTLFVLIVGQTPLFLLACIVLGEVAEGRGWKRLGRFLWALAFLKPHIAFVLLPLAYWRSGWRRPLEIAIYAGALNVLAGLVFFCKPLFVFEYLQSVQNGHLTVEFNRVTVNKQITSWNRLICAAGFNGFELGMLGTLASYAVLAGIVWLRMKWSNGPIPKSWMFAVAGSGAMLCCQLLPYELPLLALLLPHLIQAIRSDRRRDIVGGASILLLLLFAFQDGGESFPYYCFVRSAIEPWNAWLANLLLSHRALGVFGVSVTLIGFGPVQVGLRRARRTGTGSGANGVSSSTSAAVGSSILSSVGSSA